MQPESDKQRRARMLGEVSYMAMMSLLAVHRLDAAREQEAAHEREFLTSPTGTPVELRDESTTLKVTGRADH